MSQNELARHFGKVHSATSGWTSGRTQPSMEELAEICRLTETSADTILGLPGATRPIDARAMERALKKAHEAYAEIGKAMKPEEEG